MSKLIDTSGALADAPVDIKWPNTFLDVDSDSGQGRGGVLDPPAGATRMEFSWAGSGWTPMFDRYHSQSWRWAAIKTRHDGTVERMSRHGVGRYGVFFDDQASHPGTFSLDGVMSLRDQIWVGMVVGFWTGGGSGWDAGPGNWWSIRGRVWVHANDKLELIGRPGESGPSSLVAVAYK